MAMGSAAKRELRVALSRRAQPVWFRMLKWVIAIGVSLALWRTPSFWWWIAGATGFSLAVHFLWRWKTKGWTQAWGGWDDVQGAGRDGSIRPTSVAQKD